MRENYNHEELEAARILDAVRAGIYVPDASITWALWVMGDLVGIR